jgi:hypothetical protein
VGSGYAQLSLRGRIVGKASANVAVLIHGTKAKIKGGKQTKVVIKSPADWCEYYGVPVKRGVAILYKGLNDQFISPRGGKYQPGEILGDAPDWDGGKEECGGGWHFSPHPKMTLEFNKEATKFVAVPIKLKDFVVHPDGEYPQKVKGKCGCAPMLEVDQNGKAVESN